MTRVWLGLTCLIALLVLVNAECPHLTSGLLPWSSASSWASGSVPTAGADVVIPSGKKILLDVSPPDLNTLLVEADAQLVWSPAGEYELRSKYVLVKGRLDIGSEDCKFDSKAYITLLGKVDAGPTVTGFGRKFLGVAMGGTIELHGADPLPAWTKLAKTAHNGMTLGGVSLTTLDRGLNLAVFSPEGVQLDYVAFDLLDNSTVQNMLSDYLNKLPQGSIIAAAISDAITPNSEISEATFTALAAFGVQKMRQRNFRDSYAVIGVKGGDAVESYATSGAPSALITREFLNDKGYNFKIQSQSGGWSGVMPSFAAFKMTYFGEMVIDLVNEVYWKPGDKIVLAATDYSPEQSEEATLVACPECSRRQVKLSAVPQYMHYGEITNCVDERAEVGLLTRNIVVRGEVENECYGLAVCNLLNYKMDLYGGTYGDTNCELPDTYQTGHFKVMHGFANAHVEGVEFYKMGQQILGSYPIHFHLCGDVDEQGGYSNPAYVKKNSIHRSLSRCVTIHGTSGLLVQDNVAFDHLGHCIFLEDGIERRNVIDSNLALWTRFGSLLPTDRSCEVCKAMKEPLSSNSSVCGECAALSTYWLTNPDNVLTNNVAGGSDFVGIWYVFPERPTGDSEALGIQLGIRTYWTAMGLHANNTAHSNRNNGMFIDNGIKAGNQTADSIIQRLGLIGARFNPRVDFNDRNSARAPAIIKGYRAYKNQNRGAWARGGDIWFEDCVFADNSIGLTLASEGSMPNDPGSHQSVVRTLFVGLTDNKGQPSPGVEWDTVLQRSRGNWPSFPMRGFEYYDGPLVVEDVAFTGFPVDKRNNASAIGSLLSNNWQSAPVNFIRRARFYDDSRRVYNGAAGREWFTDYDGDRKPVVHDVDGSLTGVSDSYVVRNMPFYTTPNCYPRPDWEAQICKERYGQLYIRNADSAGTNYNGITTGLRFSLTRDDNPDGPHNMLGIPGSTPAIQWQPLVMLSKGYTVKFTHPTPPQLTFQLTNWNARDWTRVGVCYPPAATFAVTKEFGSSTKVTLTKGSSIQEVDNSVNGTVYFYDSTNGVLFFKAVAENDRNGFDYCASKGCEVYRIKAEGGQVGTQYTCTPYPAYQVPQIGCDGANGKVDQCGVCNGLGDTCQMKTTELDCRDYGIYPPSTESPNNAESPSNGNPNSNNSTPILAGVSSAACIGIHVFSFFAILAITL